MAIVISSRSKAILGVVFVGVGLLLTLIVGSAVGWFDEESGGPVAELPYMPYRDSAIRNRIVHSKQVFIQELVVSDSTDLAETQCIPLDVNFDKRLESDAITDLTSRIWSHVRLQRCKKGDEDEAQDEKSNSRRGIKKKVNWS